MSENGTNGHDANADGMSRILSLSAAKQAPKHSFNKWQRAEVERLAYDMVIQECAKVHEHYLTQIPHFVARMIQDALMTYGLIQPEPGTDIAPAEATAVSENAGGDTPPADTEAPPLIVNVTGTPVGDRIPDGGHEGLPPEPAA